jgi:hypothetical protein
MPPLSLAVAAIPGLFKAVSGAFQASSASSNLRRLKRPQRETPESIKRALGILKANTVSGMPGESQMYQRSSMNAMNALRAAREGANPLGGINAIQSSLDSSYLDIGQKGVEFRERARQQYVTGLEKMGAEEDKNWMYNKFAPYADKYQQYQQMLGAGMKNIHSGLDSLSLIGSSYLAGR